MVTTAALSPPVAVTEITSTSALGAIFTVFRSSAGSVWTRMTLATFWANVRVDMVSASPMMLWGVPEFPEAFTEDSACAANCACSGA